MNYKAVIFDMDGTIVDTEHIWAQASHQILERRNIILDAVKHEKLFNDIHGLALHKSCLLIKEAAQLPDNLDDLVQEKSQIAFSLYDDYVKFIPGFIQFHQALGRYNLKTGIATNASPETAALTESILNLRNFFGEHIYNMAHVNYANKPDPAIYVYAAKQLAVSPEHCIAIEDSAHGIVAAKSAGMFCIGINTADNSQALQRADIIVDGYHQIDLCSILGAPADSEKSYQY